MQSCVQMSRGNPAAGTKDACGPTSYGCMDECVKATDRLRALKRIESKSPKAFRSLGAFARADSPPKVGSLKDQSFHCGRLKELVRNRSIRWTRNTYFHL